MKRISLFLKTKINLLALLLCGSFSGFWMIIKAENYYYCHGGTSWDPAYHAQSLWCLIHGSFCPSVLGANFIANHCLFLSFLLAPLYWIFPDPLLLEYLQVWGFFAGAYIFFLILKKYLHPFIALGAMIAFILAPANISMLLFVFNYEPFSIPLVLLIFKALCEKKFPLYIICCLLLAMVKEQMPLAVVMFGVFALLFKKDEKLKWGLLPLIIGLVIFIMDVFVITPYVRMGLPMSQSEHWWRYMQFGRTPQQIFIFLFSHPLLILKQLVLPENIKWYNDLFGIWGSLALLSPHILLPALLIFLKTMLSRDSQEHVVTHAYYASTYAPFIFLAAWNTLNHIQNKWRLGLHTLAVTIMLIHASIFMPLWLPKLHILMTSNDLVRQRFIDKIPPNASVLSGWATLAPLCNRKELYPVRSYLINASFVSDKKFSLSPDTDYLLLDFADELLLDQSPKKLIPKMTALNFDNRWRLQESIEDIALYVKNPSRQKADRLIDRSFKAFPIKNTNPQAFDRTISLEAIEFPPFFPQKYRIFPVTMYWKCLKKTDTPYNIFINITSSKGKSYYSKQRPIGSTIYPTYFWRTGEHVKESYFYLLPHMPQGSFIIKISIYNTARKKWVGEVKKCYTKIVAQY